MLPFLYYGETQASPPQGKRKLRKIFGVWNDPKTSFKRKAEGFDSLTVGEIPAIILTP
jgi:hypothetical protein